MMNRYSLIEEIVDTMIEKIYLPVLKCKAYTHLHGCVLIITQLALERHLNVELARISAILHDLATYQENCPHRIHAKRSSELAKQILLDTNQFKEDEINCIVKMIAAHSQKDIIDDEMCELLKDADLLTTYYTTMKEEHQTRLHKLIKK